MKRAALTKAARHFADCRYGEVSSVAAGSLAGGASVGGTPVGSASVAGASMASVGEASGAAASEGGVNVGAKISVAVGVASGTVPPPVSLSIA